MVPKLTEVFVVREARISPPGDLKPGTPIQILDKSPGSAQGGTWLGARIRRRLERLPKKAQMLAGGDDGPGYVYGAPWKADGESFVYDEEFGNSWRLTDASRSN